MTSLELKVPPVAVLLVAAIGLYFTPVIGNYSVFIGQYTWLVALVVFGLAVGIGALGVLTFKKANTTVHPVNINNTSNLVTHGIFQFTRNPMYLSMALVIVAMSIHTNNAAALFWIVPFSIFITNFHIKPEERMLLSRFGEDYANYTRSVKRWIGVNLANKSP